MDPLDPVTAAMGVATTPRKVEPVTIKAKPKELDPAPEPPPAKTHEQELDEIKAIHPAKRTASQVRKLHGLPEPSPPPEPEPPADSAPTSKIENQIGDRTPAQAKASANGVTPRSDIIDKGLAVLHEQAKEITEDAERTGKAAGGAVTDDRLDRLMLLVAEQAEAINKLTAVLSSPQTIVRDKEGRIKEVRRLPAKKDMN